MKKRILMLLLSTVSFVVFCQNKVRYSYDNSGNRVSREIVVGTKSLSDSPEPEYYSEMLSEKDIRIYPNPTEGRLRIEVSGWGNSDKGTLNLYNLSGQLILKKQINSSFTDLDITSKGNGLYVLYIQLNGQESSWKIIKK